MKLLITLRQQLGINQEYFALLLGLSRGQLSMTELGKRQLSAKAIDIVLQLQAALPALDNQPLTELPSRSLRTPRRLSDELDILVDWCTQKGKVYEQLAAQMQTRQQQALLCLQLLPQLFPNPDRKQALVLDLVLTDCRKQVAAYNAALVQKCRALGEWLQTVPDISQ